MELDCAIRTSLLNNDISKEICSEEMRRADTQFGIMTPRPTRYKSGQYRRIAAMIGSNQVLHGKGY